MGLCLGPHGGPKGKGCFLQARYPCKPGSACITVPKNTGVTYALNPAPYTLHPTPYTLHPTPYTLHPTPYTLHVLLSVFRLVNREPSTRIWREAAASSLFWRSRRVPNPSTLHMMLIIQTHRQLTVDRIPELGPRPSPEHCVRERGLNPTAAQIMHTLLSFASTFKPEAPIPKPEARNHQI